MKNRNNLIKNALFETGVSQDKLAKELGVSSQTVNERLNKGDDVDSIRFIKAVCKLTGRPFTDFVDLTDMLSLVMNEPREAYGNWKTLMLAAMEAMEKELKEGNK